MMTPAMYFPSKCTESVGTLKKVTKEENPESFHNFDARSLVLWNVFSIAVDDDF